MKEGQGSALLNEPRCNGEGKALRSGSKGQTWRPFLGARYACEMEWRTTDVSIFTFPIPASPASSTGHVRSNNWTGVVLDGGMLLQKGRLGIAPEVRYTHWGGGGVRTVILDQNQSEFLLTLRF